MKTALTDAQYQELFDSYERSVFRLEQQPAYDVDFERDLFEKFVAGHPEPPDQFEEFRAWYTTIAAQTAAGISFERVRLVDDPPTAYQRWTRYMDGWNIRAGETIHYLSRKRARRAKLTEAFEGRDFWLFDDERLVIMTFDVDHRCTSKDISTDDTDLQHARMWRDLAITTARGEN